MNRCVRGTGAVQTIRGQGVSTGTGSLPEVQRGQGGGATRQVPRRPHAQLRLPEQQLRLSAGADGAARVAAVEGREGREPLQRVGDGRPPVGPQLVAPGPSRVSRKL